MRKDSGVGFDVLSVVRTNTLAGRDGDGTETQPQMQTRYRQPYHLRTTSSISADSNSAVAIGGEEESPSTALLSPPAQSHRFRQGTRGLMAEMEGEIDLELASFASTEEESGSAGARGRETGIGTRSETVSRDTMDGGGMKTMTNRGDMGDYEGRGYDFDGA